MEQLKGNFYPFLIPTHNLLLARQQGYLPAYFVSFFFSYLPFRYTGRLRERFDEPQITLPGSNTVF